MGTSYLRFVAYGANSGRPCLTRVSIIFLRSTPTSDNGHDFAALKGEALLCVQLFLGEILEIGVPLGYRGVAFNGIVSRVVFKELLFKPAAGFNAVGCASNKKDNINRK